MESHNGMFTKCVAFGNQKGGVTKTSTVVNLAAALSERGKKVLVWDLDVNCGSTRLFGVPSGINIYGTYEVMVGEESAEDVIIRPGDHDAVSLPKNVHLIAGHTRLEAIETALAEKHGPFTAVHEALREPIASLRGQYDYIFLDTSPSMTPPTKAAYMAAEYFILTAVPERLAIEGLVNAIQYIQHARRSGNPNLKLMGVVMNQVPGRPTRLSRALLEEVDRHFDAGDEFMRRFRTSISTSTIVPSMQQQGATLFEGAPDHKVTDQYRKLAEELENRFSRHLDVPESGRGGREVRQMMEVSNG
jgi:chromosome partitioning protein